ncbi:Streptothricin hydrolase [Vibrio stylophorae]|uniref:Streptothricin hydrolase n=1 Tax=Vibrio stylophorae TaxID=659351 RepID=A0ABN8DWT3_9VIBR|nr:cysteine hydrolase family protein [Vibrio stylophorae]CAH0535477.1 Streptothricin hydrolase [Vibrio stylophorae]
MPTPTNRQALLVIDLQHDYFPEGKFPLWNTAQILENIKRAIGQASAKGMLIVHIQHIADPAMGLAPFFNEGSLGAQIHPHIIAAAPNSPVVVKHFADSFEQTNLNDILQAHDIETLYLCGMMTQNCVTHTALSKSAEKYQVSVLADCTTTVNEMLHLIALHALSPRIPLLPSVQALA